MVPCEGNASLAPDAPDDVRSIGEAVIAYELSVAEGIRRGLDELAAGRLVSPEESRAMRAAAVAARGRREAAR